jgi:hypothetical protein
MKRILCSLISIVFFSSFSWANEGILDKLRPEYMKALHNFDFAPAVYEKFEAVENPSAKLLAYKGALEAIMTRTTWNVFKKIGFLNKSQETFEEAIALDSNNVEVRFMRLSVEHSIPGYLGYSVHMKKDKKFVVSHISEFNPVKMDPQILKEILNFVQKSGHFSAAEISLFKGVFTSI